MKDSIEIWWDERRAREDADAAELVLTMPFKPPEPRTHIYRGPNQAAVMEALTERWERGPALAKRVGLTSAQAWGALDTLEQQGIAESRGMGMGREYRRLAR